ncbi:hypothetical protein SAMN02799630_05307 [Paenibacillus sp. UNCCL117]|uniref:family 16 glycoside hydrolase n=1 Tax=unclassified Paenibacillus TaxID=185978 RepID=UPI00089139D4|nr:MULTISPECIES: family 16 glycoside hydrolase [unclassified Paenibacillus]SDE38042.1 hypothetical protein SAMN04488602_12653 [Paenibacillus sp. cl123]SFW65033.1 hypothetical protein SAMN02799630_05307 [Paenibacillus sp. UNCCL117]
MRKGTMTKVSVTLATALIVQLAGGTGLPDPTAQAAPIVADSTWKAIDTTLAVAPGSALDLSYMNPIPAGTKGFVKIDADGDYYFTDEPNKKVKFFGTNLNGSYGQDPSRDEMVVIADRIAAMGYNSARFHSIDENYDWAKGLMEKPTSTTVTLNSAKLDNFEYFLYLLKERGIYINIDLMAYPDFSGVPGLSQYGTFEDKNMALLFPEGKAIWRSFAQQLLTHVNPYTGIALKDDPILMGLSPMNEAILYNANFSNENVNAWFLTDFNLFLAGKGRPAITTFPNTFWSAPASIRDDLAEYFTDKALSSYNEMKNYLTDVIGIQIPIGGMNYINDSLANYWRTQTDIHETHLYNGLVDGRGASFSYTPARHPRYSMRFDPETAANYVPTYAGQSIFKNYIPGLALGQLYQKPFALTEYNQEFPTKGRDELGLIAAAAGAHNGWDMLQRFQYVSRVEQAVQQSSTLGGFTSFDILTDTLVTMSEIQSALLFRKGGVTAGQPRFVIVRDKTSVKTDAASTENEDKETNRNYIPHLFKMVTVYADKPGEPYAFYKITPDLTPEQIASGNIPAQNKITITNSMTIKQVAETFINALDDVNLKNSMLANLNQNKLVSDTGELVFDLNLNTYLIDTPYMVGAVGTLNNNTFELGPVSLKASVDKGTVSAAALDDQSLDKSERIVVIHTTDVAATGEDTIQDPVDSNKRTYVRGTLPTLAKYGTLEFRLKTTLVPAAYKAYKLATNGVRLQELPVVTAGDEVIVQFDTDKGYAFELVYDAIYADGFEAGNANGWSPQKGQWSTVQEGGSSVYLSEKSGLSVADATYGTDYWVEADVKESNTRGDLGLVARYADSGNYYAFTYHANPGKAKLEKRQNNQNIEIQSVSGLPKMEAGTTYKLRFETVGTTLKGYLNGQLVISATDPASSGGKVGLITSSTDPAFSGGKVGLITSSSRKAYFDNVVVRHDDAAAPTAPSNLTAVANSSSQMDLTWEESSDETGVSGYKIYRDGQEIATVNGVVNSYKDTGLTIATTYQYKVKAFDSGGRVSEASNEATATTTNTLLVDDFEDGNANGWSVVNFWGTFSVVADGSSKVYLSDNAAKGATKSVAGSAEWSNYKVEAKTKVDSWSNRVGLIARYVDPNNFYAMYYDTYSNKLFIVKNLNGSQTTLASAPMAAAPTAGVYHTYSLEVNGSTLKAYVDGQLLVTATDSSFTAGKIGVYSHVQKAYFDDVVVTVTP